MKLMKILRELNEAITDPQGIVSSDGNSIELNIPTKKYIKFTEKVPHTSFIKFKNGQLVRHSTLEPTDGLPLIDQKQSKNYTESDEYWVRVIKNRPVEKITFENIIEQKILRFHYNPNSDQPFTVRDDKNKVVGVTIVADSEDKQSIHIFNVNISEEYRGMGVANAFYDFIEKKMGKKITRDTKGLYKALSKDGERLWNRRNSK